MSTVANDLESLVTFRQHLMEFNGTLRDEFSRMRGHWASLGDIWRDAKYQEFGQALDEVSVGLDRYLEATAGHEGHLLQLIEAMRAYLGASGR